LWSPSASERRDLEFTDLRRRGLVEAYYDRAPPFASGLAVMVWEVTPLGRAQITRRAAGRLA
jgi:hypothetical protein